ncbi:MAG: hypothetical protein JWP58_1535 [Hymenobacter sp.]|nr:hypothetical protein [Hymenobacter sp.]
MLGHSPSYNLPDPKELSIHKYYSPLVGITGSLWILSFLFWVSIVVTYVGIKRGKVEWKPLMLGCIGHLVGILLVTSGIGEWEAD